MKKKHSTRWEVVEALAMVTQIGLSLILCMSISLFIGYLLDGLFGTRFIIIIMIFVGIGASVKSLLTLTKSFTDTKNVEGDNHGDSKKNS